MMPRPLWTDNLDGLLPDEVVIYRRTGSLVLALCKHSQLPENATVLFRMSRDVDMKRYFGGYTEQVLPETQRSNTPNKEYSYVTAPNKRLIFPVVEHGLYELVNKSEDALWTSKVLDMGHDRSDFEDKLNTNEKEFIKLILGFFAISDRLVMDNLEKNVIHKITLPEAKSFYRIQHYIEQVHEESYLNMIDNIIGSSDEKNVNANETVRERERLFHAAETISSIKRKARWIRHWTSKKIPFLDRLLVFACVEGIFFSASFAAMFWLRKKGIMPGTTQGNEYISRDEGLHTTFAVMLYDLECRRSVELQKNAGLDISALVQPRRTETEVHALVAEAVFIESEFVRDALHPARPIPGMNADMMCSYVRYVADHLLVQLGYSKLFGDTNPFDFMDMISLQGKTNFFEKKVTEYKFGVAGDRSFRTDVEF